MLIDKERSIIPACDMDSNYELYELIMKTHKHPAVGAYKIGLRLALYYGLLDLMRDIRNITDKPIIYDHQKAGNDIPDMGAKFADACRASGIDAVILFPFVGDISQKAWIEACQLRGLHVIVGGEMTHPGFNGYISEETSLKIYSVAADNSITDFVVPGNKPEKIRTYKTYLEEKHGVVDPIFYSPGLITQGGDITESGEAAGEKWHAIVGRALYTAEDPCAVLDTLSKQL